MDKWVIGKLVREQAEHRSRAEPSESGQNIAELEASITADIQALIDAKAIRPRVAHTDTVAAKNLPVDPSWYFNRRDLGRVLQYTRNDNPGRKAEYIEELAGCFHNGRYTLSQAAEEIAEGAGEQYDSILKRLKLAVLNKEIRSYGRGHNQEYLPEEPRSRPEQISHFYEELLWGDLNDWLLKYEDRIAFKFPEPLLPGPPGVDTAETTPGLRALARELAAAVPNPESVPTPAPQKTQVWQEDQIIRATRALGYDPQALPPDDRKKNFYVKSIIRDRCAKNHPTKMRATIFNKAWDRMRSSTPKALIYAE